MGTKNCVFQAVRSLSLLPGVFASCFVYEKEPLHVHPRFSFHIHVLSYVCPILPVDLTPLALELLDPLGAPAPRRNFISPGTVGFLAFLVPNGQPSLECFTDDIKCKTDVVRIHQVGIGIDCYWRQRPVEDNANALARYTENRCSRATVVGGDAICG